MPRGGRVQVSEPLFTASHRPSPASSPAFTLCTCPVRPQGGRQGRPLCPWVGLDLPMMMLRASFSLFLSPCPLEGVSSGVWGRASRSPHCSWGREPGAGKSPGRGCLNGMCRAQHEGCRPHHVSPKYPSPHPGDLRKTSRGVGVQRPWFGFRLCSPPSFSGSRRGPERTSGGSDQDPLSSATDLNPVPMAMEPRAAELEEILSVPTFVL